MTEAYAIKGPDGVLHAQYIRASEMNAWEALRSTRTVQYWIDKGYTCVQVTVSEKGEAVALRNSLQDLSDAILALGRHGFEKSALIDDATFVLWVNLNTAQAHARGLLDDLSRGQG